MLTLFNSGDVIGRILAAWKFVSTRTTIILSVIRVIFFATFFPIAFSCAPKQLFGADWFKMLNIFLFGLSNGYCACMAAMLVPGTVQEHLRQECG